MSTLEKAAQQALEALTASNDLLGTMYLKMDAITALRSALAQQEPRNQCGETCERAKLCAVCARGLEQEEPLSVEDLARALVASRVIDAAALDDPEGYDDGVTLERVRGLHRRLAALAQQEREPVAWLSNDGNVLFGPGPKGKFTRPLYTHPPRREWQSLTEEEIGDVFQAARNAKLGSANDNSRHRLSVVEIARAVEQALKEKNHE